MIAKRKPRKFSDVVENVKQRLREIMSAARWKAAAAAAKKHERVDGDPIVRDEG